MLDKFKELRFFKDEEGVLKANLKMTDGTEVTTPLKNYKAVVETVINLVASEFKKKA